MCWRHRTSQSAPKRSLSRCPWKDPTSGAFRSWTRPSSSERASNGPTRISTRRLEVIRSRIQGGASISRATWCSDPPAPRPLRRLRLRDRTSRRRLLRGAATRLPRLSCPLSRWCLCRLAHPSRRSQRPRGPMIRFGRPSSRSGRSRRFSRRLGHPHPVVLRRPTMVGPNRRPSLGPRCGRSSPRCGPRSRGLCRSKSRSRRWLPRLLPGWFRRSSLLLSTRLGLRRRCARSHRPGPTSLLRFLRPNPSPPIRPERRRSLLRKPGHEHRLRLHRARKRK